MLYIRCCPWFLASTFVLVTLGSSCTKPDESVAEAEPELVAIPAAEDEPLVGHEFLRLTEARPRLIEDLFVDQKMQFALDELENYYVGVGSRVLVVERSAAKPEVRVIELTRPLELLGIRGQDLILFGSDPARCGDGPRGQLYAMDGPACASVFALPTDGEGTLRVIAAFDDARDPPVLVGDHVAALDEANVLMHVPLTGGEVRRTKFDAHAGIDQLAVEGDRLLWQGTVSEGSKDRSVALMSRAPFDEAKVAFQLEGTLDTTMIVDIVWIGEGIAYLVVDRLADAKVDMKLYRRTGEQTDLLMTGLPVWTRLVNDGSSAWLVDFSGGASGVANRLWRIGLKEHRLVTTTAVPQLVIGTRSGLAWVEERVGELSFHLAGNGPPGLEAPAIAATIVEAPPREPDLP